MSREDANQLKVFSGRHDVALAKRICEFLDIPLGQARTDEFPDGELIVKLEEDVRGRDCYVILSTCQPVNDNLVELPIHFRQGDAQRFDNTPQDNPITDAGATLGRSGGTAIARRARYHDDDVVVALQR